MNKKSVYIFASFLLIVVGIYAGLTAYSDGGATRIISNETNFTGTTVTDQPRNWSKGGSWVMMNITAGWTNDGSSNITQINLTLPGTGNWTAWYFLEPGASGVGLGHNSTLVREESGNIVKNVTTAGSGGVLFDWYCTNESARIDCWNGTTVVGLGSENTSWSIQLGVHIANTNEEDQYDFNITTADNFGSINRTMVVAYIDDLEPRLIYINITDGNTTYSNVSWKEWANLSSLSDWTVKASAIDQYLTAVEMYYKVNTSADGKFVTRHEVLTGCAGSCTNMSVKRQSFTGTAGMFSQTIPTSAVSAGNNVSFLFFVNDSFNWNEELNYTKSTPYYALAGNGTLVRFDVVNATDSMSSNNTLTNAAGSTGFSGGNDYLDGSSIKIRAVLLGIDRSASKVYLVYNTTASSATTAQLTYMVNGQFYAEEEARIAMTNISGTVDGTDQATGVVYETIINLNGNDTKNFEFWVTANSTTGYTTLAGPYKFTVDESGPISLDIVEPTDLSISYKGSITYKCKANDATSGVKNFVFKLEKPDGTTITKTAVSPTTSAGDYYGTQTFTTTDTDKIGSYTVKCVAYDNIGHSSEKQSSATEGFTVRHSTAFAEGAEGAAAGEVYDVDFSVNEEVSLSAQQGIIKSLSFDGMTKHTVTFKEITDTTVTLEIASSPITVTLTIGETKNVDINNDGTDDIAITLENIANNKAVVAFKKLAGAAIVAEEEKEAAGVPPSGETPSITPPAEEAKGKAWLWITIIVILAVVAIGYFVMKKKK